MFKFLTRVFSDISNKKMTPLMFINILNHFNKYDIDGYLINTSDEHSNEYIGPSDERMKKLTKFTGSNGLAILGKEKGYLWTDGRYHIQAENELKDNPYYELVKEMDTFKKILAEKFNRVGLNKKVFSKTFMENMEEKIKDVVFVHVDLDEYIELEPKKFNDILNLEEIKFIQDNENKEKNFVDVEKISEIIEKFYPWIIVNETILKNNVTGSNRLDKIKEIQQKLEQNDMIILTTLDEIAWVFNLRGNDIEFNPVFYSFAIIDKNKAELFLGTHFDLDNISVSDNYKDFYSIICNFTNLNILISDQCNAYVFDLLKNNNNTVKKSNMISLMKSTKNNVELLGFVIAHIYDGIALCQLFEWLDTELNNGTNPGNLISEKDVSRILLKLKRKLKGFKDPSFETISSTGDNSAIIHHKGSDRIVKAEDIYLIDSGSQYFFGTTDVTRTLNFGSPTPEQKKDFTLVLKGQIDAINIVLHRNYSASAIDFLARHAQWKEKGNEDFAHSTGHGVGHFLNVHEAPPSISTGENKLKENMVFSIEPGKYMKGKYGIRIEDLVTSQIYEKDKFDLKNITVVPLQLKMIEFDMLNSEQKEYIKNFNHRARNILKMYLSENDIGYKFMMENTEY